MIFFHNFLLSLASTNLKTAFHRASSQEAHDPLQTTCVGLKVYSPHWVDRIYGYMGIL